MVLAYAEIVDISANIVVNIAVIGTKNRLGKKLVLVSRKCAHDK